MFQNKILLPHQYYYPAIEMMNDKATLQKRSDLLDAIKGNKKDVLLYIHFPFCDSHCAFCGFDKRYNLDDINLYVQRLKEELLFYSKYDFRIKNIHLGGGTPTLVPGKMLSDLIQFVKNTYECAPDMDINMEGSATSIYRDDIIRFIKENGITRTSVGVQTFNPDMRAVFQTQATIEQVYHTLETLKKNEIGVFIDILFGYPDFSIGISPEVIVANDLKTAVSLGVEGIDFSHIYPYGNKLASIVKEKGLTYPTTAQLLAHMDKCMEYMEVNGYHQETSYGFVKKGRIIMETSYYGGVESVTDTLAIGCSAFGMLNGYKYRNSMYSGYMRGTLPVYMQVKEMTEKQKQQIDVVGFPKLLVLSKKILEQSAYKEQFKDKIKYLLEEGLVEELTEAYKLTKRGRLLVDNIYYYLLDEEERNIIEKEMKIISFK